MSKIQNDERHHAEYWKSGTKIEDIKGKVLNRSGDFPFERHTAAIRVRVPRKAGRGIWRLNPARVYKGNRIMKNSIINRVSTALAKVFPFVFAWNTFGQVIGFDSYKEGYGICRTMGQDHDETMAYGQNMMRYGFHEKGFPGGFSAYPGVDSHLNNETIKKMNDEQGAFIKATEDIRQTIYEKEVYLKATLAKKDPDIAVALGFQDNISEARRNFDQKMIEHLIRMKKIDLEPEINQGR
jgi:hypothetical protein